MASNQQSLGTLQDTELQEWLESMESLLNADGQDRAKQVFRALRDYLTDANVIVDDATLNTPYRNTIPVSLQPQYPGDIELEIKIENIIIVFDRMVRLHSLHESTYR